MRLLCWSMGSEDNRRTYSLHMEGLEAATSDVDNDSKTWDAVSADVRFGLLDITCKIREFDFVEKIREQNVYPLDFHGDPKGLSRTIVERGRKWARLHGVYHMQYRGMAMGSERPDDGDSRKYSVNSRVIIDKGNVPGFICVRFRSYSLLCYQRAILWGLSSSAYYPQNTIGALVQTHSPKRTYCSLRLSYTDLAYQTMFGVSVRSHAQCAIPSFGARLLTDVHIRCSGIQRKAYRAH